MFNNKKVGSFGHISAFSFFVAHNMTTGEGGMILTNNSKLDLIVDQLENLVELILTPKILKVDGLLMIDLKIMTKDIYSKDLVII